MSTEARVVMSQTLTTHVTAPSATMDKTVKTTSTNVRLQISAIVAPVQTQRVDLLVIVHPHVEVTNATETSTSVRRRQVSAKMEESVVMSRSLATRVTALLATAARIVKSTSMNASPVRATTAHALTKLIHTAAHAALDTQANTVTLTSTNVKAPAITVARSPAA